MTIIYEGYESNHKGRPINSQGKIIKTNNKGQIIFNSKGTPVLNNNNNNFKSPKRISQDSSKNIKQHEKTNFLYKIKITNKNGVINEKFLFVNKDGKNIMDRNNKIYLNKETGEPISGNGKKKYLFNKINGKISIIATGYNFINNSNNSFNKIALLPKKLQ
jgi:hypothetical protein